MRGIDLLARDISRLSGEEYSQLLALCEESPQILRKNGYVVVEPATTMSLGRMCRSELGSRPRSIADVLGLEEHIRNYVIERLEPRCAQCECKAIPPKTLGAYRLPETGVIALSVVDTESGVPLQERANLLGVERVCVNGYLMPAVDISQEEGEPVLCAAAVKDIQEVKEISDHWFARGGKELRVLHYNSRDSEGREVGLLYNFWSCPQCSRSLPKAPRALEQDSPACAGCRGEGWILDKGGDDAQRWVACRDCDALGFRTEFSSYCFYGLKLWQVLVLSFIEFRELVIKDSPDHEIVSLLSQVCAAELGDCPMGAVYDLCSPGERMLVTVAQLRLARLEDVRCLLDGAYGDLSVLPSTGGSVSALSVMRSGVEPQRATLPHFKVPKDASRIVIRDVNHGALHIDAVTFPQGAVTAICGPAGVGKSLFLQIVKKRFSQRRKRAHVASFGDLQRCWFVEGGCERTGTLLSVLDFAHDLAREISRTRRAKELGILADDLELPRSKYRCERCLGGELSEAETVCSSCQGALYDWRVAELPLLGVTVREILQAPLFQVATKLWSDSSAEALFRVLVDLGVGDLSLGFQARVVSPALRRTLKLCAMLARVGSLGPSERVKSGPQDLANQLVLLDGPRILPGEYEEIIAKLLYTLSQRGATILYASPPEGLESCCQSVVRLGWSSRDAAHRAASRYLDQRFARGSGIAV